MNLFKATALSAALFSSIYFAPELKTVYDKAVQFPSKIVEDSVKQGQVISFGKSGYFWDSYEGSLALGGESRSESFAFSLDREARNEENLTELSDVLKESAENKENVKIYGKQVAIPLPWRSSTGYHVYKVEKID